MKTCTIRDHTFLLPSEEADDLIAVSRPPRRAALVEALITDGPWTGWQAGNDGVQRCQFTGVALTDAAFSETSVGGCTFTRVDLSGSRWRDATLDRTVFRGCRLLGTHLTGASLKNVIFDDCRLDYAVLDRVRTAGPVAFLGCTLTEAAITRSKFPEAIFDRCRLTRTELADCDLYGADLRGSDLTTITGVTSLAGAMITQDQAADLIEPMIHDLRLQVTPLPA